MATTPNYAPPLGTAEPNTPSAPNPPQSPSDSVTNESATDNYDLTQTSTEIVLEGTGPNIPQQGTATITNVSSIMISGVPQAALQVNNWNSGSVGQTGNKFS